VKAFVKVSYQEVLNREFVLKVELDDLGDDPDEVFRPMINDVDPDSEQVTEREMISWEVMHYADGTGPSKPEHEPDW
jgi:hypothetical protein